MEAVRQTFATVVEVFDLAEENRPMSGVPLWDVTPAEEQEQRTVLYGLSDGDDLSGYIVPKRKDEAVFSPGKLVVVSWSRNRGYDGVLVAHVMGEVQRTGGGTICIETMYEGRELVRWYER